MSQKAKINTLIEANPDFTHLSDTVRLLKGGEVISQSDFFHQDYAFNAVKLFDKGLETFWHCQVKDGKNMNLTDKENHKYTQDPYVLSNAYTSVYQGGGLVSSKYVTPITGGGSVSGSWAQITFPTPAYPSDMTIQVRQNNYNTESQKEIPKKVTLLCSDQDQDIPDNLKTWKHLATYDFGTKYSTQIEFAFSGIYGYEYFDLEINGKKFSSYVAKKVEESETINISGLDSLKINFVNRKSFPQTGGAQRPGIMFSKFTVNGKEMRDFIQHETRRKRAKPVNGMLRWGQGYDLVAAFPGDAETPMYMPITLSADEHKYQVSINGCRTVRLVVEELYGGTKFNIAKWNILGTLGKVPTDSSASGATSFFAGKLTKEGFTNRREPIDNTIFNGIYTNSPDIKGIPLSNMMTNTDNFDTGGLNLFEKFKNRPAIRRTAPASQVNSTITRRQKQRHEGKYVREGFAEAADGQGQEAGQTAQDAISMEKNIIGYINDFNAEYAKYIHCNGLHMSDDKRSIKSSATDPDGKCWPKTDYHRLITKIVVRMTVAKNVNSGTNQMQYLTFLGIKEGETNESQVSAPFTTDFDGVNISPATDTFDGVKVITFENSYNDNTGELNEFETGGRLQGLHEFAGELTGVRFGFGTSKLELNALQITIYDHRGTAENKVFYDLINMKADGGPETVLDQFKDTGSATGAASNVSFDIQGNKLSFYKNGLDSLKSITTTLQNELNNLQSASQSMTKTKNLTQYTQDADILSGNIKEFKDIRYKMDMKLRELYFLDGTNSANAQLSYTGTMMSGMLWTALTASVLYYTFYEMD